MDPTTLLPLLALGALGASMAVEDQRTTRVALWKLLAFGTLALLWALANGALPHNRVEALLGAAVGGGVGVAVAWALNRHLTREAFGGADVWILAGGGAILGIQWIGPWIGLAVALGALAFPLCARVDHEHDDGRRILPFVPILLASLAVLAIGRAANLLPSIPF